MPAENVTVTATFKATAAEKLTVKYTDGVDGEEIFKDQVYEVEKDSKTPAFNGTPTRDGYTFKGWSPAVADTVTADATYTATWTKNNDPKPEVDPGKPKQFTVKYTDGVDGEEIFEDESYTVDEGVNTPNPMVGTPERTGYKFTGWSPKIAETVTENVTYTAQWEKIN